MHRPIGRAIVLVSALGLVAMGSAAIANQGRHCAYRLVPIARSGHVIQAKFVAVGCFNTFARALSAGSNGAIHVDTATTPAMLSSDAEEVPTSLLGSVLIGTEYTSVNFAGSSNSYFAPDACAGTTYELDNVGAAWNDDFESGKGFGGCDHNKKFTGAGFGGSVLTCTPNCSDYGSLRNEVTSLRWKP